MTAPITAETPAVAALYSRAQLGRAIIRANVLNGKSAVAEKLSPDDAATDLKRAYPTFGLLWAAYMATFPAGADPLTYVGVKDRIWFSRFKKNGTQPDAASKARYDRVKAVLDSENVVAAEKRAVREAAGPTANAISRRDAMVETLTKIKLPKDKIAEALKAAGLPSMDAKVGVKVA